MQHHIKQINQPSKMSASPSTITIDLIQEYLDENKWLILAIYQNIIVGKKEEYNRDLAKLRQNLEFLARIADDQPQQPLTAAQPIPNPVFHQQLSMAARSSTSAMHHQQATMTPSILRMRKLQGETSSRNSNAIPAAGTENGKENEQAGSSGCASSTRQTTGAFPSLLPSIGTENQDVGSSPSAEVPGATNIRRQGGNRGRGLRITTKPSKFELGRKPSS